MRFWFVLVLLGSALDGKSQFLTGKVINILTDQPVAYVLVANLDRSVAVRTDSLGAFRFPVPADTLLLSAPGYQSARICSARQDSLFIRLVENPLIMESISLDSRRAPVPVLSGALNKRSQGRYAPCDSTSISELAVFIPNRSQHRAILTKVYFYTEWQGKQRAPFRVRIYYNHNGKPGADLLDESVIVKPKWWKRWKETRIGLYNLPVPKEGFFVSMEWLNGPESRYIDTMNMKDGSTKSNTCFGQVLGMTDEFDECRSWTRSNGGEWSKFPCKVPQRDGTYNPMIRVEWLRYR